MRLSTYGTLSTQISVAPGSLMRRYAMHTGSSVADSRPAPTGVMERPRQARGIMLTVKLMGSSHESVQVQLVFVAVNGIRISHLRAYESAPHLRSDPKPV